MRLLTSTRERSDILPRIRSGEALPRLPVFDAEPFDPLEVLDVSR